jgi:thymidylate synthase (FAD)
MLDTVNSLRPELRAIISPAPRIYLIARPSFLLENFESFLSQHDLSWARDKTSTQSELLAEAAGRVCYMSFGQRQHRKSADDYFANIIDSGHESVLEHAAWTFLISGVSRAFTHQLVRHRAGFSFSQLSQQYCDSEGTLFVAPIEVQRNAKLLEEWAEAMLGVREKYRHLKEKLATTHFLNKQGLSEREALRALRTASRSILPNCTETKIVVSANARAIRHFLKVRGNIPGDLEMSVLSAQLLELMKTEAPRLFFDFKIKTSRNGIRRVVMGK